MDTFDDVAIILQGYSVDSDQMEKLVRYYKNIGFDNIVVSSYKSCLNKYVKENTVFLENDATELGKVDSSTTGNDFSEHRGIEGQKFIVRSDEVIPNIPGSNTNYHILTTKRGVNLAKKMYPQCDYYLKLRADQVLLDLHKFIPKWKKQIEKPPGADVRAFKKKLVSLGWGKCKGKTPRRIAWYIADYWTFGFREDIINYYNIPYNTNKKIISGERYISYKYISSRIKNKRGFDHIMSRYQISDPSFDKIRKANWIFDFSIRNFSYKWDCFVNDTTACKLQ